MTEAHPGKRVHVAVGVILNARGHVLVARRAHTRHLGGLWEFPGGKVEPGETVEQALRRELKEELAIEVTSQRALCRIEHNYPDKAVTLDVWIVDGFNGNPVGMEDQPLRWLAPAELDAAEFPAANQLIIRRVQLTDCVAIMNVDDEACDLFPELALAVDNTLFRLRCSEKSRYQEYLNDILALLPRMTTQGARVILDLHASSIDSSGLLTAELLQLSTGAAGFHASSSLLSQLNKRPVPEHQLFGVSCHNQAELQQATRLNADYALLSPVLTTASHPDSVPLGWQGFRALVEDSTLPIYALGGMHLEDIDNAQSFGARGVAGISLLSQLSGSKTRKSPSV